MERERRLSYGACEPVRLPKSARRRVRGADLPASQTDFPGSRAVRRSTGGETAPFYSRRKRDSRPDSPGLCGSVSPAIRPGGSARDRRRPVAF